MRLRSIQQRHSIHLPLAQEAIKQLGRIARNLTIQSLDQGYSLSLPTVIECSDIPDDVTEIPTPDVAEHFPHLQEIAHLIPPYDPDVQIGLLIGRDLTEAHHVLDQIV